MATRKPLVISGGVIQQLQAGDNIGEVDIPQFTNGDAGAHAVGDAVYISATDTVKKAQANAAATAQAIGFAAAAISNGAAGAYQTDGVLAGLSGLTAGSVYYLSASTAGLITTTAPSTTGQYVVKVGVAKSATELAIHIEPPILL